MLEGYDDETAETAEEKLNISEVYRNKILDNVCEKCKNNVTIVDYIVSDDNEGVILRQM